MTNRIVAKNTLREVDVIMFMVNTTEPIGKGDEFIIEMLDQQVLVKLI